MKKVLLALLAGSVALVTNLPVLADSTQTTVQTVQSPPQVIDSYMKPTVTQTKFVTEDDGTVHKISAPMVMERHEQVVMPTSEVQTTTTTTDPKIVTEESSSRVSHVAYRKAPVTRRCVARKPVRHTVAYKHHAVRRAVAYNVRKTTVIAPEVIEQSQTIRTNDVIIDRKDPALNNN